MNAVISQAQSAKRIGHLHAQIVAHQTKAAHALVEGLRACVQHAITFGDARLVERFLPLVPKKHLDNVRLWYTGCTGHSFIVDDKGKPTNQVGARMLPAGMASIDANPMVFGTEAIKEEKKESRKDAAKTRQDKADLEREKLRREVEAEVRESLKASLHLEAGRDLESLDAELASVKAIKMERDGLKEQNTLLLQEIAAFKAAKPVDVADLENRHADLKQNFYAVVAQAEALQAELAALRASVASAEKPKRTRKTV